MNEIPHRRRKSSKIRQGRSMLAVRRKKAARWALDTDVFIVPVDINELKERPKNTKTLKTEAAGKVRNLRESPADAVSAFFKDKNEMPWLPYPGGQERTLEHHPRSLRSEENYDGLNESLIQRTWEAAQALHAVVQPVTPEKFQATQEVAIYLSCMFEVASPEYYLKYSAAFKAGVCPGPWIGRAIVYKLQVMEHVDGLDDGPTASFCVGDFEGGEMYFRKKTFVRFGVQNAFERVEFRSSRRRNLSNKFTLKLSLTYNISEKNNLSTEGLLEDIADVRALGADIRQMKHHMAAVLL
ncbi:hypothetical protein R3P38DRAFT_3375015 [Favolaschia claudopus]|uniref:Uncharacterized protein n=1 Tax=Favolaschia claudopus TaxID=2862362 RepID=A0AAV9ZKH2_9AGAR